VPHNAGQIDRNVAGAVGQVVIIAGCFRTHNAMRDARAKKRLDRADALSMVTGVMLEVL
jgi:hypothetical protein